MKKIFLLLFTLFSFWQLATAQRQKYNFNSDWKVFIGDDSTAINNNYNDAAWKKVTLPYAWNEDDAFKKDIVDLRTGIAWYRKHFNIPATAKGQKIFLEFEGIRQAGDFYVNGKYIGNHENGVMAFGNRTGAFELGRVYKHKDYRELIHTYFGLRLPNIKIAVTGSGRVAHGILEIMNLMGVTEVEPDEYFD